MKTKITTLTLLFLLSIGVTAQIDRSKQPQPGPAPKITLEKPKEFSLDNGIKVLVVENHKLPRVSFSLTIDNKPISTGEKAGVESLLGSMLGNGTIHIPKDEFNEEVDFLGANLGFSSSGAFASSLTKYSDRILELMADAAIHPLLTEEEFNKEKDKLIESLKFQEKDVDAVASRVGDALSYGTKHPYGEFMTEKTVSNVSFQDVLSFYENYFSPNNAYLVVVGDVNFNIVKEGIKKFFGEWKKSSSIDIVVPEILPNVQNTQIDFVDMPNAVQSNISVTNNVVLKMNDPDFFAVKIANYILGGAYESYLQMNLREAHAYTYDAKSVIAPSRYRASRFDAYTSVRNMVTDSAVVEMLKEIKRIKTELVIAEDLKNAKAKYIGNFVMALEQPQTIASYALNIILNELPQDFYSTYLEKINAVTIEDVKRVANKYFMSDHARIIVVGKGSDVLENLEKTGIPIKYYDTYASPVDKPIFTKPIPNGVTVQTVIENYLNAIGGKDKLKTINTLLVLSDVKIEGAPFSPTAEIKAMKPFKKSTELSIEGMGVIMKQTFNGESGYMEQQGQRKDLTEEEVVDKKSEYSIIPELYYDMSKVSLESLTSIEGEDAYKIKVTNGDKDSFRFYNAKTGLLTRVEETMEEQGQSITQTVDFGNYTSVNGILFPFSEIYKAGPQVFNFNINNIKINEGVSDADFD